ncbi:MAG: hypothetical protein ACK4V2_06535 [Pseudomonadota bacterium]|nr:hypothetical protein [Alphaproteobacteria bacterium]
MSLKIFDNGILRKKIQHKYSTVIDLQNLLTQTLQQRLSLFSKKFVSEVWHELAGCRIEKYFVEVNPDMIPFRGVGFDLACSAGPLMFTNDVPGILKQWHQALRHNGVFMASFIGENSLMELKECFFKIEESFSVPHHLRFFPTIATKDAGMLMQRAGFYLPTADRIQHVFKVGSLGELLNALKAMGGNILYEKSNSAITRGFLKAVEKEYFNRYSCSGQLLVSIDIVCMTGWALKDNNEQQIKNGMRYL